MNQEGKTEAPSKRGKNKQKKQSWLWGWSLGGCGT